MLTKNSACGLDGPPPHARQGVPRPLVTYKIQFAPRALALALRYCLSSQNRSQNTAYARQNCRPRTLAEVECAHSLPIKFSLRRVRSRLVRAATTLLQKTVFVCSMVIPRTLADVCRARSLPIKFSLCGARRVGCGRERPVCAINSSAVARAARRAKMLSKIVLVCSMVPPPRARRYVPPPLVT